MTEQATVKQILLQVLQAIEDLKTDQVVTFAALQPPIKLGAAYAAKSEIAKETTKKSPLFVLHRLRGWHYESSFSDDLGESGGFNDLLLDCSLP